MRLDRITALEDDRKRRHAAIFAAVYGGGGLIYGLIAGGSEGFGAAAAFSAVVSLAALGLAVGSWHGSRVCAAALLALFLCERVLAVLGTGSPAPLLWGVVGGFLLWGGLQSAIDRQAAAGRTAPSVAR